MAQSTETSKVEQPNQTSLPMDDSQAEKAELDSVPGDLVDVETANSAENGKIRRTLQQRQYVPFAHYLPSFSPFLISKSFDDSPCRHDWNRLVPVERESTC